VYYLSFDLDFRFLGGCLWVVVFCAAFFAGAVFSSWGSSASCFLAA